MLFVKLLIDITEIFSFFFPLTQLNGEFSYYSNTTGENYTILVEAIIDQIATWGGLQQYIGQYSRIPKDRIRLSEGMYFYRYCLCVCVCVCVSLPVDRI